MWYVKYWRKNHYVPYWFLSKQQLHHFALHKAHNFYFRRIREDFRIGLSAGWKRGVGEERCFMKDRFSYPFLHQCSQDHHHYHHHHQLCAAIIMHVNELLLFLLVFQVESGCRRQSLSTNCKKWPLFFTPINLHFFRCLLCFDFLSSI